MIWNFSYLFFCLCFWGGSRSPWLVFSPPYVGPNAIEQSIICYHTYIPIPITISPSSIHKSTRITARTRSLLISLEPQQKLPKLLLARTGSPTPSTLPAQIDKFGYTFPTSAASGSILPISNIRFCLLAGPRNGLVLFPVIAFVEIVRPFLG